jgi:GGDEF domain-containing protein
MRGRRDNLTGLYNRQHFKALLNKSFSTPGSSLGLIFLDMDNFKIFNDAVSHDFGDKQLSALAGRMIDSAENIGLNAVPGRFGGDEFCFFIDDIGKEAFEEKSIGVFRGITAPLVPVSFYFDDRSEGEGMEINMISFLHRLMRPDVGSRQASRTEYIEKVHQGPRAHVVDIWKHYKRQDGEDPGIQKVRGKQIVSDISAIVEDKILYNKIFTEIDADFSRIIQLFITLQLKNHTTDRIREYLIREFGGLSVERSITLKVSAGLAHNSENRLRSMDSLFKAADSRSYLAKSNGRNCLFGVDGEQLA